MKIKTNRFNIYKKFLKIIFIISIFIYILSSLLLKNFHKNNILYLDNILCQMGFKMTEIIVQNRQFLNLKNLTDILKDQDFTEKTPSIFNIDIHLIREKFLATGLFQEVIIKKLYPNALHIYVAEKKPFGFLFDQNDIFVIDTQGDILGKKEILTGYTSEIQMLCQKNLFNFVGENANIYANQLIKLISKQNQILTHLLYAKYIENRRWDLVLKNNLIIKLPEKLNQKIISKVETFLLERKNDLNLIESFDLRSSQKVYIKYKSNSKK